MLNIISLYTDADSTFQDGKFIVHLQFLDLIMQFSEIQLITIFLLVEKLLIFTRKNTT